MQPKLLWAHNSKRILVTVETANASTPSLQVTDNQNTAVLQWTDIGGTPLVIKLPLFKAVARTGHHVLAKPQALHVELCRASEDTEDWLRLQPEHGDVSKYLGDVQINWEKWQSSEMSESEES